MKKNIIFLFLFLFFIINPVLASDELYFQELPVKTLRKVIPTVVNIYVYDSTSSTIIKKEKKSSGSGFLVTSDGLILTNKHVVCFDYEKVEYKIFLSEKEYKGKLLGCDPVYDLAILKINGKNFSFLELGDSSKLELGAGVLAIGNTFGIYENSVSFGIISGLWRSVFASDPLRGKFESLNNVIQTDANINPGNSGGPLVDLYGKVVGINVAVDKNNSVGFAIPINDAKISIKTIQEFGRIIRPRLGVRYVMLNSEIALEKGLKQTSGALIISEEEAAAVLPDTPAFKADIKEGDIILEINGVKLNNKNNLLSVIQKYKPGQKIGLKILRNDKIIIKIVVLDEFK